MSTPTFQNTAVKTVTFFRGDGIGPEISDAVMAIFEAAGVPIRFDVYDVGEAEYLRNGKLIPDAFLWSACMMLDHIGLSDYADMIRDAVKVVMDEGIYTTKDIGGQGTTTSYTDAVIREVKKRKELAA